MITIKARDLKDFQEKLRRITAKADDLTVPFGIIATEWFRSNHFIFDPGRKSAGKYPDLAASTKRQKLRIWRFVYPVLKASGRLARSIMDPKDSEAVNLIVDKKTLMLGSSVPYGVHLHYGTSKMPARPFVLFGHEQVAPGPINNRLSAWLTMIANYLEGQYA